MRKEFNMMLIVVVCAILGVICAAIINQLYIQGIISPAVLGTLSINGLEFMVFFVWLIVGIIAGVLKD